jgi:hypothetical protein
MMIDMEVVVLGDKVTAVPILSEPHDAKEKE